MGDSSWWLPLLISWIESHQREMTKWTHTSTFKNNNFPLIDTITSHFMRSTHLPCHHPQKNLYRDVNHNKFGLQQFFANVMKNAGHKKWAVFTLSKLFTHVLHSVLYLSTRHFPFWAYLHTTVPTEKVTRNFSYRAHGSMNNCTIQIEAICQYEEREHMNIQLHLWSGHSTAEFSKGFYALRVQPFNNGFWADLGHFQVTTLF